MEDVNAIHRIFKNLKYEMDNNGWVYQWHLGDEPIKVTHKFYPPVSSEEFQLFEKHFPNMKLPAPDTNRFNLRIKPFYLVQMEWSFFVEKRVVL